MAVTREQLDDISEQYRGDKTSEVMAGLNLTIPQKNSGSRNHMVTSHLEQMVMLCNPETPRVFTGYEQPYGQYTDSYLKAEAPLRIVDVISRFPLQPRWRYTYVVQNMITQKYDVIEVSHVEKLSEMHGYVRPTIMGDLWQPGSIIPQGSYIFRSENHDEHDNYRYGVNAKVCYISIPETEEDGILVSKSFSERTTFSTVEETSILLNSNDILLNLYGDNDNYKCFPDLGEPVKDGILAGRRKYEHKNVASELTRTATRHIRMNDTLFRGQGVVSDIEIFVNNQDELASSPHRHQLLLYYTVLKSYHERVKSVLGRIINQKSNSYDFRLSNMYYRAKDYLDKDLKFSSSTGVFEFAQITITTVKRNELAKGFKMTDRYGGKGVICKVVPDDMMPIDEYGVRAEVVLSPPGVVSRANIGQSYEHELNFLANHVRRLMQAQSSVEKKYKLLQRFLNETNPRQSLAFKNYWESLDIVKRAAVLAETEEKGIFIHQAPFHGNISYDGLKNLYKSWDVRPGKVRLRREFRPSATVRHLARLKLQEPVYKGVIEPHVEYSATLWDGDDGSYEEDGFIFTAGNYVPGMKEDDDPIFEVEPEVSFIAKELSTNHTFTFVDDRGSLVREFVGQRPVIIAEKYMIVLKHIPDGKFSARALGSTNPMGEPNKTSKTELGGSHSTTPIRCGEMELHNATIRVDPYIVHRHIATMATNPTLRMKLADMLVTEDPFRAHNLPVISEHIENDIPAKRLQTMLFCIGFEIEQD